MSSWRTRGSTGLLLVILGCLWASRGAWPYAAACWGLVLLMAIPDRDTRRRRIRGRLRLADSKRPYRPPSRGAGNS